MFFKKKQTPKPKPRPYYNIKETHTDCYTLTYVDSEGVTTRIILDASLKKVVETLQLRKQQENRRKPNQKLIKT